MSYIPEDDLKALDKSWGELKAAISETPLGRFIVRYYLPIYVFCCLAVLAIMAGAILGYIPTEPHR